MPAPYKVLIVPHASYAFPHGGMEVQQDQTVSALLGIGIDVELFDPWAEEIDADIVHVFGSGYPHASFIERCRAQDQRVVVTSMFMPERPVWQHALMRRLSKVIPHTTVGLRNSALQNADRVIAISESEKKDLIAAFDIDDSKVSVLSNGIEERFYEADASVFESTYGLRDYVLCVGSVEVRKNQVRLASALKDLATPVVFIGPAASHGGDAAEAYARGLEEIVDTHDHMLWIKGLDHSGPLLASAYAGASVHVLVSVAEAQGLVTMEAAAAGASIVVSDLPQLRELFGSDIHYADPNSDSSILNTVRESLDETAVRPTIQSHPSWMKTWGDVAHGLDVIYRSVMNLPQ